MSKGRTDPFHDPFHDAFSRRARKTVKTSGTVTVDVGFIYDQWNTIAEFDLTASGGPTLIASNLWGVDLSGNSQYAAGGIGGLLARTTSNGATYSYTFDGNGNVSALVDASGTVAARYEYGPFGEPIRATGPMANANPFRFSTKYTDEETGLAYFGYRFYNAIMGRWPSRDPIGEHGGLNVNAFVLNDPLDWIDILGLCPGDHYATDVDAAKAAMADARYQVMGQVIERQVEWGGSIYQRPDGQFSYTAPKTDHNRDSVTMPTVPGQVATYHAHTGWGEDKPSDFPRNAAGKQGDVQEAMQKGIRMYVIGADGRMWRANPNGTIDFIPN